MKIFHALLATILLAGITGCSKKEYFEPENTHSASVAITSTGKKAASVMRDGVTFTDGTYISKRGMGSVKLPEGFHFVNESSTYILAADDTGKIRVYRKNGTLLFEEKLDLPLISAGIRGDRIFFVQQNNVFGIYSISSRKIVISAKVGRAYAIDTRIANPIMVGSLMIVPTLDGKLLIINPADPRGARGMAIGNQYNLNNVIFLSKIGGTIIAATPRKLVSAAPGAMNKFEAPIADVKIAGGKVYALTGNGEVVKLTPSLKVLARKKFQYAQFAAIAVTGGKVYALDRSGALIVMDTSLKKYKIYDIGSVDDFVFVAGNRLYKDDELVDLSRLGYE